MAKTIPFEEEAVKGYLDECILFWRKRVGNVEEAKYYVDAFQSVRVSLFGELLPGEEACRHGAQGEEMWG